MQESYIQHGCLGARRVSHEDVRHRGIIAKKANVNIKINYNIQQNNVNLQ